MLLLYLTDVTDVHLLFDRGKQTGIIHFQKVQSAKDESTHN